MIKQKLYSAIKWVVPLGLLLSTVGVRAETVEEIFPTASVSALATGFLIRYVDLLLAFWPLIIGIAVVFAIVLMLLRRARRAVHGKV